MKELLSKWRKARAEEGEGRVGWKSPSNIALIKYWGKWGKQIPANPSLSITLSNCYTESTISYRPKADNDKTSFEFTFEGQPNPAFSARIGRYLDELREVFPFLGFHELKIESRNSFPHTSGIASSASAMSSFALCLIGIHLRLTGMRRDEEEMMKLASYLARLGSGSACRSVYGGYTVWGESKHIKGSSDLYAIPYPHKVSGIFAEMNDDILIVDKGKKEISSSIGHGLMLDHPFANRRFNIAGRRMGSLRAILKAGDMEGFGRIIEQEALMLHAMMLTSDPYYILLKPNTLAIIREVWNLRKESALPLYFSLDAGANVHLIYPGRIEGEARNFIKEKLLVYCENGQYICDRLGKGPEMLPS